jgi:hypothetical protein
MIRFIKYLMENHRKTVFVWWSVWARGLVMVFRGAGYFVTRAPVI